MPPAPAAPATPAGQPTPPAPPARPLSTLAVNRAIVSAAAQILARLDTERDSIGSHWASCQDRGRSTGALTQSFFGSGTLDTQLFDGFDQLVRQPTERPQEFLRLALDTARRALAAYAAAPRTCSCAAAWPTSFMPA